MFLDLVTNHPFTFLRLFLLEGREEKSMREKRKGKENMYLDVKRREMKEIKCILHFYPFNL